MYKWLFVALLAVFLCAPAHAVTRFPSGLIVGDINDSPTNTVGEDDCYIKGVLEVDGATDLDSTLNVQGAVTLQSTLAITAGLTLNGAVTLGDAAGDVITVTGTATFAENVTITNDDLIFGDGDELGFSLDANSNAFRLLGSSDADNLRDTTIMSCTTSTVTIGSTVLDVSDVELATISSRAGDLAITIADSTALATFAGAIDVSDVEAATLSARDGSLAITLSDSTGNVALAGVLDAIDAELATVSARDGSLALTLTDSTGVVAFAATPTGGSLDFSGTLECDVFEADTIVNEAGSGAPAFT